MSSNPKSLAGKRRQERCRPSRWRPCSGTGIGPARCSPINLIPAGLGTPRPRRMSRYFPLAQRTPTPPRSWETATSQVAYASAVRQQDLNGQGGRPCPHARFGPQGMLPVSTDSTSSHHCRQLVQIETWSRRWGQHQCACPPALPASSGTGPGRAAARPGCTYPVSATNSENCALVVRVLFDRKGLNLHVMDWSLVGIELLRAHAEVSP